MGKRQKNYRRGKREKEKGSRVIPPLQFYFDHSFQLKNLAPL